MPLFRHYTARICLLLPFLATTCISFASKSFLLFSFSFTLRLTFLCFLLFLLLLLICCFSGVLEHGTLCIWVANFSCTIFSNAANYLHVLAPMLSMPVLVFWWTAATSLSLDTASLVSPLVVLGVNPPCTSLQRESSSASQKPNFSFACPSSPIVTSSYPFLPKFFFLLTF